MHLKSNQQQQQQKKQIMQQTLIDIVMKPEYMKEKRLGNTEKPAEYLVVCECVHECVFV